jgi:hypothetical protein
VRARIVAGIAEESGGRSVAELEARRGGLIDILRARTIVAPQDGAAPRDGAAPEVAAPESAAPESGASAPGPSA